MSRTGGAVSRKDTFLFSVMRVAGAVHRLLYRLSRGKIGYNFRGRRTSAHPLACTYQYLRLG